MSSSELSITSHSLDSPEGTIQSISPRPIGAGMPPFAGGEGMAQEDEDLTMAGSTGTFRSRGMSWPPTRFPGDIGMALMDIDETNDDGNGEPNDAEAFQPMEEFDPPRPPTRRWSLSFPMDELEDITTTELRPLPNASGMPSGGLLATEDSPVMEDIVTELRPLHSNSAAGMTTDGVLKTEHPPIKDVATELRALSNALGIPSGVMEDITTELRPLHSNSAASMTTDGVLNTEDPPIEDIATESRPLHINSAAGMLSGDGGGGGGAAAAAPVTEYSPMVVVTPTDQDVLLGQSRNLRLHPGNQRLRDLVAAYCQRYKNSTKLEKTDICKRIVQTIRQEGGRFLIQPQRERVTVITDAQWVEITDLKEVGTRMASRFRDQRAKERRLQDHDREGASI